MFFIGLLSSIFITGCNDQQKTPKSRIAVVGVWKVQTQHLAVNKTLTGRSTAYLTSEVRPQVSGIIQKRLFTEGQEVHEGQVLYQIDPATYLAAYHNAQGALLEAQAAVSSAKPKVERYRKLVKIDAISQQELDDAIATLNQNEAAVVVAKAELETAKINLDYTKIKAPISGTIGLSGYTPGALVTAGQDAALTTINQLNPINVDLNQSTADMLAIQKQIKAGHITERKGKLPVKIELEDGSVYPLEGTLTFVGTSVSTSTGNITLRAQIPNPDKILLPGMYVHAILPVADNNDAILVPQNSITYNTKGEATVKVLESSGVVKEQVVTVSSSHGAQWVVDSGLKQGDSLIVQGYDKVSDGETAYATPVHLNDIGDVIAENTDTTNSNAVKG